MSVRKIFGLLKGWNIDTQKLKDELREEEDEEARIISVGSESS